MARHDNTTALYAALFGNLAIAITKFIAAGITVWSIAATRFCCSTGKSGRRNLPTLPSRWGMGASSTSGASWSP